MPEILIILCRYMDIKSEPIYVFIGPEADDRDVTEFTCIIIEMVRLSTILPIPGLYKYRLTRNSQQLQC